MPALSQRVRRASPSAILQLVQKAAELKAAGRDIIDLGIGEPDFDTPEHIKRAGREAIDAGRTGYTPINGVADLKRAIIAKFHRDNGLDYAPEQIAVSCGGKQIIFNALMASVDRDDEVIIPAPYWASYPDITLIAGGRPVIVACDQQSGFKLSPAQLAAHITPRTRWVIINSPSNPTGSGYRRDELLALADVLREHPHIWILSDDIYEQLCFDGFEFATMAAVAADLRPRTLTMNGVSKAYAMTGWRLGYAGGPEELIGAMSILQGHSTSHTSSITQYAAIEALTGPQDLVTERAGQFRRRRDLVVDALNRIDGFDCRSPEGAFYVFPSVAGLIGRRTPQGATIDDDAALSWYLLEQGGVSTVHGAAFGLSPHLRLSYAASTDALREACARIARVCAELD